MHHYLLYLRLGELLLPHRYLLCLSSIISFNGCITITIKWVTHNVRKSRYYQWEKVVREAVAFPKVFPFLLSLSLPAKLCSDCLWGLHPMSVALCWIKCHKWLSAIPHLFERGISVTWKFVEHKWYGYYRHVKILCKYCFTIRLSFIFRWDFQKKKRIAIRLHRNQWFGFILQLFGFDHFYH